MPSTLERKVPRPHLDHEVHVVRELGRERLAAVGVLALLHHGLRAGAGLGEVLLGLDALAVPDRVDARYELGERLLGGLERRAKAA